MGAGHETVHHLLVPAADRSAFEIANAHRAALAAAVARVQAASRGPAGDIYDLERVKGGPHASIMRYTLARDAAS